MSKVEVVDIKKVKPLIVAEKVTGTAFVDPTMVWGLPSQIVGHWCHRSKLGSNRSGYWVVIDKTNSEYKNVRTVIDDTPNQTMFTKGDLVLCGMHKDTYAQIEKQKIQLVKQKTTNVDKANKAKLAQIAKEGVKSLKTVLKNEDEENEAENQKEE